MWRQTARMRPSCCRAVTPSSRPISSTILPSLIRSTVVPVKCIFRPVAAGNDPTKPTAYNPDVAMAAYREMFWFFELALQ